MFGSKLRSWMENHIGRPRKKGNKNKNNASNETFKKDGSNHQSNNSSISIGNVVNGHYGSTAGNNITSPVRRREVSPIQNHSRYGWQSPDSETITSPKSDNFLYAPQRCVRHQKTPEQHKDLHSVTSEQKPLSNTPSCYQQQQLQNNSSSSFSSLSWSTGSKEQQIGHHNYAEKQTIINDKSHGFQTPIITFHGPNETNYDDDNADTVHYEEIQTILRQPHNNVSRNILPERPKSEQLSSFAPAYRQHDLTSKYAKDDSASARYGKLLPSRIRSTTINRMVGSAESLPCNKNNNYDPMPGTVGFDGSQNNWQHQQRFRNVNVHIQQYPNPQTIAPASNMGNNGSSLPFHVLSSPESAYSTGYSTDGTSPGTCHNHPPEYYINMRTGTHYFPKSINSLAIEAQRYKFGLNKIEEMSPIDPLPNVSFATINNKISTSNFYVSPKHSYLSKLPNESTEKRPVGSHSPLVLRNAILLPTLHGFESSSPRQRCRIRTNPWYSTSDAASTGFPTSSSSSTMPLKQSVSMSATSSTLSSSKSSTSTFGQSNILSSSTKGRGNTNSCSEMQKKNSKDIYDSSSSLEDAENDKHSTFSFTEVEAHQRTNTFCIKRANKKGEINDVTTPLYVFSVGTSVMAPVVSDEDATLNEMMGKFDESYVYEKETDILSDSDETNCPSELDTGLDAEDECDTEDLLDIDFIDTSSMKEVHDRKEFCFNKGNGAYSFTSHETTTRMSRRNRHNQDMLFDTSDNKQIYRRSGSSSSHRRKRLIKTRKKNASECKEIILTGSPLQKSRETRSVGGTPISLRRNSRHLKVSNERLKKILPMPVRSSSLIFHPDPLMKADLEADVKYRQLIEEAESILVSIKSSTQTLPRETPVSSPRRLNPLANKRVEMLKSFEGCQQQQPRPTEIEPDLSSALNKRIELLKYESTSVPNSPKSAPRFSPSKTHITNFINQIDGQRKPPTSHITTTNKSTTTDQHRLSRSPTPSSPFKMQMHATTKQNGGAIPPINDFDSDLESEGNNTKLLTFKSKAAQKMDLVNHNCLPEITRMLLRDENLDNFGNHNTNGEMLNNNNSLATPRFCPQSEPLKRKVYKGSNTFERLKFSFDLETTKLQNSHFNCNVVENFNTYKTTLSNASSSEHSFSQLNSLNKTQLLLNTLSDLKQNLENQSVELNGLNAN